MSLNYNYIQDLNTEKLQCWCTPRAETKTNPDFDAWYPEPWDPRAASYFTDVFSERSLFIGMKREKEMLHLKTKESAAYFKVLMHFPQAMYLLIQP